MLQFRDQLLELLVVHPFQPLLIDATLRAAVANRPTRKCLSAP
jgi:hypothetical protein